MSIEKPAITEMVTLLSIDKLNEFLMEQRSCRNNQNGFWTLVIARHSSDPHDLICEFMWNSGAPPLGPTFLGKSFTFDNARDLEEWVTRNLGEHIGYDDYSFGSYLGIKELSDEIMENDDSSEKRRAFRSQVESFINWISRYGHAKIKTINNKYELRFKG